MANEFYALMGRMRYISRWGLMRNSFVENVQEHSHQVAVLAHALALIRRDILHLDGPDPDRCAVAALYHDASETLTGDMPTPIKYDNPAIRKAYKDVEAVAEQKLVDFLPEELRPKSGYGNTYAKLWWDRPSTTITRNFACPSSSRCIHPRDSRAMTIREGARLQSFPDDYVFYGCDAMKRLEIGNAVPPLLSVAIARQMLSALESE